MAEPGADRPPTHRPRASARSAEPGTDRADHDTPEAAPGAPDPTVPAIEPTSGDVDRDAATDPADGGGAPELRVTTLEAFFDLVFVFAVTQLTSVLVRDPTPAGVGRTALLLAVVWWMYGGYAWLTNVVPPVRTGPRLLLVAAMAGFLVIALAVPTAFGSGAPAFAIGYLLVVLVHGGLFLSSIESRPAMLRVGSWNLGAAALLLVAAFVPDAVRWALWTLVAVGLWGGGSCSRKRVITRRSVRY